jgi:hypothetical protein
VWENTPECDVPAQGHRTGRRGIADRLR